MDDTSLINGPGTSNSTMDIQVDEEFFFEDLYIVVENTAFKVPRRNFQVNSEVFANMFKSPVAPGQVADGLSLERPLRLEGIKRSDFVAFLTAMFPLKHKQADSLTTAHWISVLKLSHMWSFDDLHEHAISKLSNIPKEHPAQALALASQIGVSQWFLPALDTLVKRPEPIGMTEAELLGMEMALKIASIRDKSFDIITSKYDTYARGPAYRAINLTRAHLDYTSTIKDTFGL